MNKEEYAQFHYLLAKLKFDLCEEMGTTGNDERYLEMQKQVEEIDDISKILIIDYANPIEKVG